MKDFLWLEKVTLKLNYNVKVAIFLIIVVFLSISGCKGSVKESEGPIYIPPTMVVKSTSTPFFTPIAIETPKPTLKPTCTNNLLFVNDVTIPDGTLVSPGDRLDKRWLLKNAGTCNWNEAYQVQLIARPSMEVDSIQKLFPARSGTEFEIRMVFIAPEESGTYRSAWQAYDPNGNPFGDPFYIEIVVAVKQPEN